MGKYRTRRGHLRFAAGLYQIMWCPSPGSLFGMVGMLNAATRGLEFSSRTFSAGSYTIYRFVMRMNDRYNRHQAR